MNTLPVVRLAQKLQQRRSCSLHLVYLRRSCGHRRTKCLRRSGTMWHMCWGLQMKYPRYRHLAVLIRLDFLTVWICMSRLSPLFLSLSARGFLSASLIQFVLRWGLHRWKPILRYSLRLAKLTLKNVSFYLESWRDPWWVACYSLLGTLWESITYCNINILQSHHTTRHRRPRRHLTRWKWM